MMVPLLLMMLAMVALLVMVANSTGNSSRGLHHDSFNSDEVEDDSRAENYGDNDDDDKISMACLISNLWSRHNRVFNYAVQ